MAREPGERAPLDMDPQAVFANVEHEGAAEVLSRKLAAVEIAIAKLHDAIGSTVAAADPANVSLLDIAWLTEILQALGTLVFDHEVAAGRRLH